MGPHAIILALSIYTNIRSMSRRQAANDRRSGVDVGAPALRLFATFFWPWRSSGAASLWRTHALVVRSALSLLRYRCLQGAA